MHPPYHGTHRQPLDLARLELEGLAAARAFDLSLRNRGRRSDERRRVWDDGACCLYEQEYEGAEAGSPGALPPPLQDVLVGTSAAACADVVLHPQGLAESGREAKAVFRYKKTPPFPEMDDSRVQY